MLLLMCLQGRRNAVPPDTSRDFKMTTATALHVVDRFALSLMNTLVLVGLPLIAIGVLAQGF